MDNREIKDIIKPYWSKAVTAAGTKFTEITTTNKWD